MKIVLLDVGDERFTDFSNEFDHVTRIETGAISESDRSSRAGLELRRRADELGDFLVIWHVHGETAMRSFAELRAQFPQMRGLVVFKGETYACLGKEPALTWMNETAGFTHVVSYAVARCLDPVTTSRFARFVAKVRNLSPNDLLPFSMLEPQLWPENLVAAYLACIAQRHLGNAGAQVLSSVDWMAVAREAEEVGFQDELEDLNDAQVVAEWAQKLAQWFCTRHQDPGAVPYDEVT